LVLACAIAGFVDFIRLQTGRIVGATGRPHAVPGTIERNVAEAIHNASARLVTVECNCGACVYTCSNFISAAGIYIAPGLLAPVVEVARPIAARRARAVPWGSRHLVPRCTAGSINLHIGHVLVLAWIACAVGSQHTACRRRTRKVVVEGAGNLKSLVFAGADG